MAATKTESNVLRWNKDEKIRFPRIPLHTAGRKVPPSWDVIQQLSGSSPGVHTRISMSAAGLHYTGEGDKAKCKECELEVSNWTKAMYPFSIHATRSPNCPFVLKMKAPPSLSIQSSANSTLRAAATTNEPENPSKRQKTETAKSVEPISITLYETNLLQQVRRRTFSHWPHRTTPSSAQMLEAGFFNCNVGDRVICLYCNLICQQWTPHTDDPCEVHKTLSPNCIYVKAKLIRPPASSIVIVNEPTTSATASGNQSPSSINLDPLRSHEIVSTAACNPAYTELPKRHASFASWAPEDLPSVDDLVRAGFFYTGSKTIVTCFYCNGSLQNWGPNDNPMIEHARWFPHCPYAKQLCGDDLYRKIQESKRAQQERARANEVKENNANGTASGVPNSNSSSSNQKLLIPDESTLSRLVAARLDLPISQRLLSLNFKLSIIKRCWEDQLRLKHDDFMSECDLFVACTILQKQIEHIDGKKENIAIPSVRMKQIREQNELRRQNPTSDSVSTSNMHTTDVDMTNSQSSTTESSSSMESNAKTSLPRDPTTQTNNTTAPNPPANASEAKANPSTHSINDPSANSASSNNTCVLCWSEEKRLACMPCGHLATCVPCGHSLRSCPICRREIEAFVRIYI